MSQESLSQCNIHLSGSVKDSETGLPVSFAFIEIQPIKMTTVADSNGVYHIHGLCPGNYQVVCTRVGFLLSETAVTIQNDTLLSHHIIFDPSFYRVVEVESNKNPIRIGTAVSQLNKEDLMKQNGRALSDQLENLQGVYSLKTGSSIGKPVIHGLHSSRVLVYNNGIRHEGQQWGSEHAPEIDPQLAEQITIAYGSAGLRYGHDVIGGVILIEPSDIIRTPGFQGEVNLVGRSNGRSGSVSGKIEANFKRIKSLGLMFQGTTQKTGNIHSPDITLDNTGHDNLNYATGVHFNKSRFGLQFFYSIYSSDIGIFSGSHTGNLTDLNNIIDGSLQPVGSKFTYNIARPKQHVLHELHKVRLHYVTGINSKIEVLYARQYNLREEYDKHIPRNDSIAGLNKPELKLEITTHSTDASWILRKGTQHTFQIGLCGTYQANTYEGRYVIPNFERYAYGAYLFYRWQGTKTTYESCIRYDVNDLMVYRYVNQSLTQKEHETSNVAFAMTVDHNISEYLSVGMSAGRTWRAMQANELYSNGLHHGAASFEIGDSTLHQEQSNHLLFQFKFLQDDIFIQVDPFVQFIDGYTFQVPTSTPVLTIRGAFPVFAYEQKDSWLTGIDAQFKMKLPQGIHIYSSCSILRARERETHLFLPQMPADRYSVRLSKEMKDYKRFLRTYISWGGKYINKQWRVDSHQDYLPAPNAYYVLHAETGTTWHTTKADILLSLSVDNLLNTTYRDYLNRFRYYADEPGRNFTVRITYQFKNQKNHDEINK
ncbi:MAG: TonB-dependent receptor [Flavobacteriales bacterium]|nr:TonB-dependent receptor [Flavobacteriales bacterium]